MNAKDRIETLANYFNLSIKAMAEMCGYDRPQAFYDVQKGKTKEISPSMANKIISAFPEINKVFLLTGEGEMLNPKSNNITINGGESQNNIGGQMVNISLPEKGSQKIIKPDGTVEVRSMDKNIENSNNTDKFIELLKKKDEQIDRLITLLENK